MGDIWAHAPWLEAVASVMAELAEPRPLMTLRVSRDSGQTWGRTVETTGDEHLPPMQSQTWPLCACDICGGGRWWKAG